MSNGKLSGKVRVRAGLFGALILQVEYSRGDGPDDAHGMPEYLSATGLWRDATVEDLSNISLVAVIR